jgi:hypothetical protein
MTDHYADLGVTPASLDNVDSLIATLAGGGSIDRDAWLPLSHGSR